MRICLINPNSTDAMGRVILKAAQRFEAATDFDDELSVFSIPQSPALINSDADEVQAAYWTLQKALTLKDEADAFVIGCHSDPGVGAVAEATGLPCVGIGYASLKAACLTDGKVGILVISEHSKQRKERLLRRYGLNGNFISIPTSYTEEMSAEEVNKRLCEAAKTAADLGCRSIVLGCAGMSVATDELRKRFPLPVYDGVEEALRLIHKNR